MIKRSTLLSFLLYALFAVVITACRKDENVSQLNDELKDTTAVSPSLGSFLASAGQLKINFNDSTYVFDAAKDSIAFVKVDTAGNQYFGLTAIDSAHNLSFGISGIGIAKNNSVTKVEGSQFLFNAADSNVQAAYTLSKASHEMELGKLSLKRYSDKTDSASAKGSFTAFLSGDTSAKAPMIKVTGSFDLQLK
jgi:hypothetical protein